MRFIESQSARYDLMLDNQTLCWGFSRFKRMGMKVIGIVHDSEPPTGALRQRMLRHADRVLVLSPHTHEELGSNPEIDHRKLALVPRGHTRKGERAAAVIEEVWADLPYRTSYIANER
jgi:hypothetical protein